MYPAGTLRFLPGCTAGGRRVRCGHLAGCLVILAAAARA